MWKYYALLAAVFASLTAIFSKVGVRDVNPDLATALRVSFILPVVWLFALYGCPLRQVTQISGRALIFLFLSALATGLSWIFYFRALHTGDVSRVAPIDKLSVPLTILFGILFLGEPASWKVLLGGALIFAGTLVLLF